MKSSKKPTYLRLVEGGRADASKALKVLTHKDIKELLAKFAEAILVDQERVNKLPRKRLHSLYDHGMWTRNREDHVSAIVDLSMTVDQLPKRLLKEVTELAIAYKPELVRSTFLNQFSDLATQVASPWLYETASLFFREMIKDVSRRGSPVAFPTGNATERMLKWFQYDDPIEIAKDPECEYFGLLASHIERESEKTKRALAARARHEFIRMRVIKEFCDYIVPQERDL
jgi:hypothetical protein